MQRDIASICTAIVLFANITQLPFSQASSSGCRYKLLYGTYKTCWIDLRLTFLLSALVRQRKVPFEKWESVFAGSLCSKLTPWSVVRI